MKHQSFNNLSGVAVAKSFTSNKLAALISFHLHNLVSYVKNFIDVTAEEMPLCSRMNPSNRLDETPAHPFDVAINL